MIIYRPDRTAKFTARVVVVRAASAVLATLSLLFVAACAMLPRGLDARIDGYVGRPEADLIQGLGRPQQSWSQPDGSRVLRFGRERTEQYGGQLRLLNDARETTPSGLAFGTYDPAGKVFRKAASEPTGRLDPQPVCAVDVSIDAKGIVRSWTARPGDCRAN